MGVLPDRNAIEKLYEIKKRDKSKKLIALIADISTINEVMDSTDGSSGDIEILEKIASVYWPGDLTVVIKAKKEITKIIEINDDESNDSTIGVRIPNNPIALEIIRQSGGIVLTTSANFTGENPVKEYEDLNRDLADQVDYVVHGTNGSSGIPSTIIKIYNNKISIIRDGSVHMEEIMERIGKK
ncbi:MAG: L-threonylcarbamoyladenylate synthase [Leptotrichiaceae bacterium]